MQRLLLSKSHLSLKTIMYPISVTIQLDPSLTSHIFWPYRFSPGLLLPIDYWSWLDLPLPPLLHCLYYGPQGGLLTFIPSWRSWGFRRTNHDQWDSRKARLATHTQGIMGYIVSTGHSCCLLSDWLFLENVYYWPSLVSQLNHGILQQLLGNKNLVYTQQNIPQFFFRL